MTIGMTRHDFWFIYMYMYCIVDTFFTLNDKYFCMDFLDMFCLILFHVYMILHVRVTTCTRDHVYVHAHTVYIVRCQMF